MLLHMDLQDINKFYQYLVADLLDYIMNLFFQIQSVQLLILRMDDKEFVANFTTSSKLIIFCTVLLYFYI